MKVSKVYLDAVLKPRAAGGKKAARRRSGVSESTLVTAILKMLQLRGVFAWRANAGTQVIGAKGSSARRVIHGAPAGTPDILLVLTSYADVPVGQEKRLAVLHGIEVKTPIGKQSETQRAWQAKAESFGVRYGIARSVGQALELVKQWSGS